MSTWRTRLSPLIRRNAATLLVAIAIDLVVGYLNPFGIQDAIKARAAETLQLVAAPFYGGGKETPGQRVVTVVMIDPAYFKAIRPDRSMPVWPMSVNLLTMGVIQRILDAKPNALFIDIAFPDAPREIADGGTNSRAGAIDALRQRLQGMKGQVPIFLADDIVPDLQQQKANAECGVDFIPRVAMRRSSVLAESLVKPLFKDAPAPLAHGARPRPGLELVDASWSGAIGAYPLGPSIIGDGNCLGLKAAGQGFVASPALALFKTFADNCPVSQKAICVRPSFVKLQNAISVPQKFPGPDGLRLFDLRNAARKSMSIRWGVRLSNATMRDFRNAPNSDECHDQFYAGPFESGENYFLHMISPAERSFGQPNHRACVYIDTLSAAYLLDRRHYVDADEASGSDPDYLNDFIKDRIVLLGVDLPTSGDQFASPINGSIPGVYIHAAALENLITSGDRYHVAENGWLVFLATVALGASLLVAMTALWGWLCEQLSRRYGGWGEHLLAPLGYGVIMFVFCTGLILLLTEYTNLPLTEIAAPVVVLHFILFGGMIENWRKALKAQLAA